MSAWVAINAAPNKARSFLNFAIPVAFTRIARLITTSNINLIIKIGPESFSIAKKENNSISFPVTCLTISKIAFSTMIEERKISSFLFILSLPTELNRIKTIANSMIIIFCNITYFTSDIVINTLYNFKSKMSNQKAYWQKETYNSAY